jgi:hypothetical protein
MASALVVFGWKTHITRYDKKLDPATNLLKQYTRYFVYENLQILPYPDDRKKF